MTAFAPVPQAQDGAMSSVGAWRLGGVVVDIRMS